MRYFSIWQVFLFLYFLNQPGLFCQSEDDSLIVYVWDFAAEDKNKDLALKFTEEFETALINSNKFPVLERRNFDRLYTHTSNEQAILEIAGLSNNTMDSLRFHQANTVIFGEIIDDKESGEIKIIVTFQALNGRKIIKESTRIRRGLRYDAKTREEAMAELVTQISPKDLLEKRRQFYDNISIKLNTYVLKLKNLKNAFLYFSDMAFSNKNANDELIQAIKEYNKIYKDIDLNRHSYKQEIVGLWEDPGVEAGFKALLDFMLNDVHELYVIKLNRVRASMNRIISKDYDNKEEKKLMIRTAKTEIAAITDDLTTRIPNLQNKIDEFIDLLNK